MAVTLTPSSAFVPSIGWTRAELRGHAQDVWHDVSARGTDIINRAIDYAQNIAASKAPGFFLEKSFGTIATVDATKAYTVSWDDPMYFTRVIDQTNDVALEEWPRDRLDREHPDYPTATGKGKPEIYSFYGRDADNGRFKFQIYPSSDAVYTLEFFGFFIPAQLTDGVKSVIPGLFHHVLQAIVHEQFAASRNSPLLPYYERKAQEFLADLASYRWQTAGVRSFRPRLQVNALGNGTQNW